jgi:alkylation response protein AidB-like acyl-CoA dehydrogenase
VVASVNPLIEDRLVELVLYGVLDTAALCALPHFRDHNRETFDLFIGSCRRFAREELFATYRPMDERPARFDGTSVICHPLLRSLYPRLVELGVLTATRPHGVGGQQLPAVVAGVTAAYLGAANGAAVCYAGITAGAAHLIETFGTEQLRTTYMQPMYAGHWTGTMALTEPQAGSGLMDVQTRATALPDGSYRIQGSKVFISGGDNDFAPNVVHLALARIEGAPAGTRGVSLFVVPKLRPEGDGLVPNDVKVTGAFHKLGWGALVATALNFGEAGECRGYLVGEANQGLKYMFQMMNESRLGVGTAATATAMTAYHQARLYALERLQGRRLTQAADAPPVPIIEHADVRRMLLRQKAIAEGAFGLVTSCNYFADLALHAPGAERRAYYQRLLDLLTPVAKSFPSERGFESTALAVQVHGGYGYTREYLPEAWLRDQKLNAIHEGTTGIQSLDLLGRKVLARGETALDELLNEVSTAMARARQAGLPAGWLDAVRGALDVLQHCTAQIGQAAARDVERALQNSVEYLDLFGTVVIAWQWLQLARAARERLLQQPGEAERVFLEGELRAAQYWIECELPRIRYLAGVIGGADDAFFSAAAAHF